MYLLEEQKAMRQGSSQSSWGKVSAETFGRAFAFTFVLFVSLLVSLFLGGGVGSPAYAALQSVVPGPWRWVTVEPGHYSVFLQALTCTPSLFCALSDSDGNVLFFENGSWSAPEKVLTGGDSLSELSCANQRLCIGVGLGKFLVLKRVLAVLWSFLHIMRGQLLPSCRR
jgi:hypothetical protein